MGVTVFAFPLGESPARYLSRLWLVQLYVAGGYFRSGNSSQFSIRVIVGTRISPRKNTSRTSASTIYSTSGLQPWLRSWRVTKQSLLRKLFKPRASARGIHDTEGADAAVSVGRPAHRGRDGAPRFSLKKASVRSHARSAASLLYRAPPVSLLKA
jgi:hypothetical protein